MMKKHNSLNVLCTYLSCLIFQFVLSAFGDRNESTGKEPESFCSLCMHFHMFFAKTFVDLLPWVCRSQWE